MSESLKMRRGTYIYRLKVKFMFVGTCNSIPHQKSLTPRAQVLYNKEIDITTTHWVNSTH